MGFRVVFAFILAFASIASAQNAQSNLGNAVRSSIEPCEFELSFIKGSKELEQTQAFNEEILKQLQHLPFNSYKLIGKKRGKVALGQRLDFKFEQYNHRVSFEPVNLTSKKIQAKLSWKENEKTNLINTKMWFEKNKNIVFGSQNGHKCKIINVEINCDR